MPFFCHFSSRLRVHPVLEQKKFFVKVVDGVAVVFLVGLEALVQNRLLIGVIDQAVLVAAIGKGPGDALSADGIQPVGVLHDFTLQRLHGGGHSGSLVGDGRYDVAHMADGVRIRSLTFQPLPRFFWADGVIAIVKFPVGDVVQESAQFHHSAIRAFRFAQLARHGPNPVDVPPVVARTVIGKQGFHVLSGFFYDPVGGSHIIKTQK